LEEFKHISLGLKASRRVPKYSSHSKTSQEVEQAYSELPEKVDWRVDGTHVNPVKNQGTCGSCWAFSTIGSIESAFAIKSGSLPSLSEEQLVQCSKGYGNGGCSGGFMEYAFKYAESYPLCTEDEYPYEGKDSPACSHQKCAANPYTLQGFEDLEIESRLSLYTGLTAQPVSIAVCAGNVAWQFYKKGVMKKF
jgi:cathepsin L